MRYDGLNSGWNFPFDEALGQGVACQASDFVDIQLVHDLLTVFFNGLDADA
jgi:hypothetical protein